MKSRKLSLFQIPAEVFPEMQPELSEERGEPAGHAEVPGGRELGPGGGHRLSPLHQREHVRPQQLQARAEGAAAGRDGEPGRLPPHPRASGLTCVLIHCGHSAVPGQGDLPQRGLDGGRPDRRHHRGELLRRHAGVLYNIMDCLLCTVLCCTGHLRHDPGLV